jgi:hypothetical protein
MINRSVITIYILFKSYINTFLTDQSIANITLNCLKQYITVIYFEFYKTINTEDKLVKRWLSDNFICIKLNNTFSTFCNEQYIQYMYSRLSNDNKIDDFSNYVEYETIQGVKRINNVIYNKDMIHFLRKYKISFLL